MKIGRKGREEVIGDVRVGKREKTRNDMKKWAGKRREECKRGHGKAHVKG